MNLIHQILEIDFSIIWDFSLKEVAMINFLKSIYIREEFNPRMLGVITNPFYLPRRGLFKRIKSFSSVMGNGRILDVGCGSKPYRNLFQTNDYIGLDIENDGHNHDKEDIDVFYDGDTFPFKAELFDSILCNQVLEHVFNPNKFLGEVNRVLKKEGLLLLTAPFMWDEHEKPFDYARYSSFGLKHILEQNGFEILSHQKTNSHLGIIFIFINIILYKLFLTKNVKLNLITNTLILFPINLLSIIFSFIKLPNKDIYIDNVVLAKKIKNV